MMPGPGARELQALDGAGEPLMDGESLMRRIGALLEAHLSSVPLSDPYRGALDALACACAAGYPPQGSRGPRAAP
jgi:hypothetical protein